MTLFSHLLSYDNSFGMRGRQRAKGSGLAIKHFPKDSGGHYLVAFIHSDINHSKGRLSCPVLQRDKLQQESRPRPCEGREPLF